MSEMDVSVVVVAYNNWWLTRRCLLALEKLRSSSPVKFETIVVDNASSDETQEGIAEFPWVRYARQEVNTNFAGGANIGVSLAQAPYVMFLNNDAVPAGDVFPALLQPFEDTRVAVTGGCILFEDGPIQAIELVVLDNAGWWTSYRNLPATLPAVPRARDVLGVNGAGMFVDKAWFQSVGGFDEGYINGSEDIDLYMHARKSGRTLRYVPEAVFYHYESASPNRYDYDEQNAKRFFRRWHREMEFVPRIERGEISAFAIHKDASVARDRALNYALEDLVVGLRQFGHPIVRGNIRPWSRFDRRFRDSATLAWFSGERFAQKKEPSVQVIANGSLAELRTFGVERITVPWLPCALPEAAERCAFFYDADAEAIRPNHVLDCSKKRQGVSLVVLDGLTDPCAYGNLALAHAGIPVVIADAPGVRNVYCEDTAIIAPPDKLEEYTARALAQPQVLRKNAERMRADAERRFTPRRAAMRFTDVARVARHGFERPGIRRSDSPVALD